MLKHINVDVDGVLADILTPWCEWIRANYGDDITPEKVTEYGVQKFAPNAGMAVLDWLDTPNLYDGIEPIDGAVEGMEQLKESGFKLKIVTKNPPASMKSKVDFLLRHFGHVITTNDIIIGPGIDKSRISGDVLIDDDLHNLRHFPGLKVLYDAPYNQDPDFGAIRFPSWHNLSKELCRVQNSRDLAWDIYFMKIARTVAARSSCDRASVGCVLVKGKRILATGYNGAMSGDGHCDEVGHLMRDGHCIRTIHAEENAIIQAASHGIDVAGSIAYVTHMPCWGCFKKLRTAGIAFINYNIAYRPDPEVVSRAGSGFRQVPC